MQLSHETGLVQVVQLKGHERQVTVAKSVNWPAGHWDLHNPVAICKKLDLSLQAVQ